MLGYYLIGLQIPFMKTFAVRKYGGYFNFNGPCVKVSTSLNHVITQLPRMPNELQLHPMNLKHKLEYKGHYNDLIGDTQQGANIVCLITEVKQS